MNRYISSQHVSPRHPDEYVTHTDRGAAVEQLRPRQILDSRGWPTVAVDLRLADGAWVTGAAPAGAALGSHEAAELRDGGDRLGGRGVVKAMAGIRDEITPLLAGRAWMHQAEVDRALLELDGTPDCSRLGANAIVATSIAMARAFAEREELPLWEWISRTADTLPSLPVPHFTLINGGRHTPEGLDFQGFMVAPVGAVSEADAVAIGADVHHALEALVQHRHGGVGRGDEGGFVLPLKEPEEALELLVEAVERAGFTAGTDHVALAIDPAANGFHLGGGRYRVAGRVLDREGLTAEYERLVSAYPIRSIEDGYAEDDETGWALGFSRLATRVQLVADDLYVTDPDRIRDGAQRRLSTGALIKPNQIGTVTSTLEAIAAAHGSGLATMVAHRSGETEDTFIADLAVGAGAGQIKAGAPARGERVAKYNRLTTIEQEAPELHYTRLGG